jgi:putative hemolysin
LDNCIGIIHIKDLFCTEEPIEKIDLHGIKRPIMRVPLDTPLQKIFRRLLHKRMHMALVVDEFQRTVGIITLEHIIEELVGDIQDEFDKEQDSIQRISKNTYKIAGLTPIHEVEEVLNIELEHQNVSTFGGLITYELGRIPEKGEKCSFQDIQVTIEEASKRRIISTIVHKKN